VRGAEALEQGRQHGRCEGDVTADRQHTGELAVAGGGVVQVLRLAQQLAGLVQHLDAGRGERDAVRLASHAQLHRQCALQVGQSLGERGL
jgi:hypothetical protein